MADNRFTGDASPVRQVITLTVGGTIEVGDKFRTKAKKENGTVVTVETSASSTTASDVAAEILADLEAEALDSSSPFSRMTYEVAGAVITVSADTIGEPFDLSTSDTVESDDSAADAQTYVHAVTTASAGPNDWNTVGNWSGGAVPVSGDAVFILDGNVSILYGLDQSAVSLDSLRIGQGYTGSIGQEENGFYLQIDVDNTGGGNTPRLVIDGRGDSYWLDGDFDTVYVDGTLDRENAVRFGSSTDIDDLYINNPNVIGRIVIADTATVDAIHMLDCPQARLEVGANVTISSTCTFTTGRITMESVPNQIVCAGAADMLVEGETPTLAALLIYGGKVDYRAGGTITNLWVNGGFVDLGNVIRDSLTVTNTLVRGGVLSEEGASANVTYTNDVLRHGGKVQIAAGRVVDLSN